jgi:hypothetical protein
MIRYRPVVLVLTVLASCASALAQGSPTVYVTDGTGGHIYSFTPPTSGSPATVATISGATLEGIEYGPDGRLYVCDPTHGVIRRMNPNGTTIVTVFAYTSGGPHNPQCGRFSSTGDFYVVDEFLGSGVWKFSAAALAGSFPATPTLVLSGAQLSGSNFGRDSSLTQANNGDLLISDFSNGNVFLSLASPPSPTPPYSSASQIITGLDNQTGMARSSTGDIFIAQKGLTNKIARFDSTGASLGVCGVFGTDRPYFIKFSADDTLYVATSRDDTNEGVDTDNDPFIKGKIWTVNIASCGSSPTLVTSMPAPDEGETPAAIGIALPPTSTAPQTKAITASIPRNFNFGFTSFEISDSTSCYATVKATQTLQSGLGAAVSVVSPAVPAGTQLVPYLGEAALGTLYHVTSGCVQANVLVGAFTPSLANPRIVKCDPFPTSCAVLNTNAVYPLGGPILGDGAVGSGVPNFSDFFLVDEGLSTALGVAGTFCGFNRPLSNTTTPAGAPVFDLDEEDETIPVKFQLGQGPSCKKLITNATALLSVARVDSGFTPIIPLKFHGHGNSSAIFDVTGKQYHLNLNVTGYAPGTYSVTVTFLSGNASPVTTYFKLVP